MKAPDKIWYDAESHTIVLEKHRAMDGDEEYIRNDAEAMQAAGYESVWSGAEASEEALISSGAYDDAVEISDLLAKLATARNDALEDVARWHERQRDMMQDLVDHDGSINAEPLRKALYSTTISEHDSAAKAIRAMMET